ncbi:MAG: hypothetical protein LBE91_18620 [Tannerella sp.]|jgi:hypothetical protein|nr:hypothetical protein [Tannerella sp.]
MQKQIDIFHTFLLAQDIEERSTGLFTGKMGIVLYLYHQFRLTGEKKFEQHAGKLLDSVYSQVDDKMTVDWENGLSGICWSTIYLIENGFVKGNPNYILKDLDDKIFSSLYFDLFAEKIYITLENMKTIVQCALYFCKRCESRILSHNERVCFERIIIKSINRIEESSGVDKMPEPFPFSSLDYFPVLYLRLIEKVYQLGFYTYKIEKVCDEWSKSLLTVIPYLHAHRFSLSNAMERVNCYYNSAAWRNHISMIKQNTDIEYIILNEFPNRNILPHNGLTGFYFFLKENGLLTKNIGNMIREKIKTSEQWNDFDRADDREKLSYLGLMTGLSGAILAWQDINSRILWEEKR